MPINELNSKDFAQTLAKQAMEYVPQEFNEEQKGYITKKVYEFSLITGEHLLKQYKDKFDDNQAVVIVQFIGEWTFHKAIDVMRAGLDRQHWDQILQQVAFAALKSALHANMEKFEDAKTAAFIEYSVKTAYEECINQLIKANALTEDKKQEVLSQSNVDKMAEESGINVTSSEGGDEKSLKYLATALLLKKMPEERIEKILGKMDEVQQKKIRSCLQIEDLEKKLDASIINNYIKDLNKNIISIAKPKTGELIKAFKNLQTRYGEEEIINLTLYERSKIQKFLSDCMFETEKSPLKLELSPYIVKILYNHLRNKLAAMEA